MSNRGSSEVLAEALSAIMAEQKEGARRLPPHLQRSDDDDLRTAVLGLFVELGELTNELQWKPWRVYDPPTLEEKGRVLKEFGDVLHFLAWMLNNLEDRFDLRGADFADAFFRVAAENRRRFSGEVPGREPPPGRQADPEPLRLPNLTVSWTGGPRTIPSVQRPERSEGPLPKGHPDWSPTLLPSPSVYPVRRADDC